MTSLSKPSSQYFSDFKKHGFQSISGYRAHPTKDEYKLKIIARAFDIIILTDYKSAGSLGVLACTLTAKEGKIEY